MGPIDDLRSITRQWLFVLIVGVLGGAAAWGYAASLPAQYQATNTVFVTSDRGATTSELLQSSTFAQNLVKSYTQLAATPTVLSPVITRLHLDTTVQDLASRVTTVLSGVTAVTRDARSSTSPSPVDLHPRPLSWLMPSPLPWRRRLRTWRREGQAICRRSRSRQ